LNAWGALIVGNTSRILALMPAISFARRAQQCMNKRFQQTIGPGVATTTPIELDRQRNCACERPL